MVANLVKKENNCWYCSKCRMRQSHMSERCEFCWSYFSNYEEVLLEEIETVYQDEVEENGNFILN